MKDDSIISSGFAGFSSSEKYYGFVYETIASKKFNDEKNRYATGSTQVSLTNEGLEKIEVLLPTCEIIEEYSKFVEPLLLETEKLKKECRLYKKAQNLLLVKLIGGEIEV